MATPFADGAHGVVGDEEWVVTAEVVLDRATVSFLLHL
jgi:hypothetical protein